MVAAASGALALPSEAEEPVTPEAEGQTLNASLERPQDSDHEDTSAFESVIAAGESLSEKTTEQTKEVHDEILEERKKAEEREEARKEREGKVWVSPLSDYRVTASFGSRSSLWSSYHTGIDLAADYGTDVRAVSRGEIIFAGWDGAYGKKIAIQHWDGTVTWYGHLSRIAFTSGTVEPGTIIGGVGSTGNSTGPHLHLEVRPADGDPVNPATWLSEQGLDL